MLFYPPRCQSQVREVHVGYPCCLLFSSELQLQDVEIGVHQLEGSVHTMENLFLPFPPTLFGECDDTRELPLDLSIQVHRLKRGPFYGTLSS